MVVTSVAVKARTTKHCEPSTEAVRQLEVPCKTSVAAAANDHSACSVWHRKSVLCLLRHYEGAGIACKQTWRHKMTTGTVMVAVMATMTVTMTVARSSLTKPTEPHNNAAKLEADSADNARNMRNI